MCSKNGKPSCVPLLRPLAYSRIVPFGEIAWFLDLGQNSLPLTHPGLNIPFPPDQVFHGSVHGDGAELLEI